MACPFFLPTRRANAIPWLHPSRLPLGAGWAGQCCAPGHGGAEPADDELREFCNLGYATGCPRLPKEHDCDAVRFSVAADRGSQIVLWLIREAGHRPVEHGKLEYDVARGVWAVPHRDFRIQKMAECYLESYLLRRPSSANSPQGANS